MNTDRMILGKDAIYSMNTRETGLNNNVLVCGASGCGKTMSVSEPRLLETVDSNLIATVTKRRIVEQYTPLLKKRGYQVLDLNFIDPMKSNIAFDPLQYVESEVDITFLAQSIVEANPRKEKSNADPYWDSAATSLLAAEIAYVLETWKKRLEENGEERRPTFADVLKLHDRLDFKERGERLSTTMDVNFMMLEEKNPNSFAVSCWKSFGRLPVRTAGCVFGALNNAIATVFSPELREMIAQKPSVDFDKLGEKKTVLFISTSAVNPALRYFVNMFYAQAFKSLFECADRRHGGTLPIPVHMLCDDFATGSRILNFSEYISVFREKGISVTLLIQSESQLCSMYGAEEATTIINNCDTYLYMGGMDLQTGRAVSQRLDAPLNDVLYMPIGQEVVFRRGQRPLVTQRYNILEDERYRELFEREGEREA